LDFNDDDPTCALTHATLRIYPAEGVTPEAVTERLGISPDHVQSKGQASRPGGRAATTSGWFLTSEARVRSLDSRRHIHWLLDQLEPCKAALRLLALNGSKIDIMVRWDSAQGHGGPTHDPALSRRLVEFDLELWYDVYVGW